MKKASPLAWSSVSLRVGLAVMLGASLAEPARVAAQAAAKASREGDKDDEKKDPEAKTERTEAAADRWNDPRIATATGTKFEEIPSANITPAELAQVKGWSNGQNQPDAGVLKRFVQSRGHELTSRANIKAMEELNPPPKTAVEQAKLAKAIETAAAELLEPFNVPLVPNNTRFRSLYVSALIDAFKPFWKKSNHISRMEMMLVLSRSGDPLALPVFAAQLNDPDQLLVVKMLAAVGISNVSQHGRKDLGGQVAIPAAKGLSTFLREEPDAFWPTQFRALEALGSLRLATATELQGTAEFAEIAMTYLRKPGAPPLVHTWAAWALGMIKIPDAVKKFNFALVAHGVGETAVEIGEKIDEVANHGTARVPRYADLLLQLNRALGGDPDLRDSGLSHSKNSSFAGQNEQYVKEIERRVKDITKSAIGLSQAAGNQIAKQRSDLAAKVKELKAFLVKDPPTGRVLFVGGPEFPSPSAPKVATGARP